MQLTRRQIATERGGVCCVCTGDVSPAGAASATSPLTITPLAASRWQSSPSFLAGCAELPALAGACEA